MATVNIISVIYGLFEHSFAWASSNEDEFCYELNVEFSELINFDDVYILMRVDKSLLAMAINSCVNSRFSALVWLLFSFDQDMRVGKTLIQTLACQILSTLVQLLLWLTRIWDFKKLSCKISFLNFHRQLEIYL